jgi:hypothetical protein
MALNHQLWLAIIAISAIAALPAWADDNLLEVQEQGGVSYITGGIGKEESDALRATQTSYNLRIMNADKAGHFSGDTRIIIIDLQQNVLLDADSGPMFYTNLPKGRYIVEGYSGQQVKKQSITITNGKPTRVRFMWLNEMSNAASD